MTETSPAQGIRAKARHQMREAILDAARAHLAENGAAGLSLRAVARDVGMVSSALYRYFDSRDALLTALIIDAYDSLGAQVEAAEAAVARDDLLARWRSVATTTRTWALADPHQYALVYGSPVPGYAAPQDTVGPATRVTRVLADLLVDVAASSGSADGTTAGATSAHGEPRRHPVHGPAAEAVAAAVAPVATYSAGRVPTDLLVRGVMAWTYLFGAVSFELFGQRHDVIAEDRSEDFFVEEVHRLAVLLGLDGP